MTAKKKRTGGSELYTVDPAMTKADWERAQEREDAHPHFVVPQRNTQGVE